ncbi:MAG TPA: NAD(P)H-dependent oxidoreductase [Candidatus Choladousia intestinigallinarum]|nr:NAD(P)H-dependent oxidoreductase [Candidatus Choladousia intestinigallinarum]
MSETKKLVAYFSCSGVTEEVAENLASAAGADLFKIQPAIPYTRKDLDWMDKKSRSTLEMKDPAARPDIAGRAANMKEYDVIFVGFPIWWYTAPRIIQTFLESYDFKGKTIVPFATSGGSGLGDTAKSLQTSCPGARILEGRLLNGRQDPASLAEWAGTF